MNPINPITVITTSVLLILLVAIGAPGFAVFFIGVMGSAIILMFGALMLDKRLTLWELEHVLYRIREVVVEDDMGNVDKSYKLERAYRFPIGFGFWHTYNNRAYDSQGKAISVMKETIATDQRELMELRARFNKGQSRIITNHVGPSRGSDAVAVKTAVVKGRTTVSNVEAVKDVKAVKVGANRGNKRTKNSASKSLKDDLKSGNSLREELDG